MDRKKTIGLILGAHLLSLISGLEARGADKSGYHLFRPTPREEMRAFSINPSPNTVDAGHVVVEVEFASYQRQKGEGEDGEQIVAEAMSYGQMTVRTGLTNDIELQLSLAPQVQIQERRGGEREEVAGFGDTTAGIKLNLFGNDGGDVALALTPSLKFPTAKAGIGNRYFEPGLSVTLGLALPNDFSATIDSEWNRRRDGRGAVFSEFSSVTNLGYALSEKIGLYGEFVSENSSAPDARWAASMGGGATYLLGSDLVIDLGSNFGLTPAAPVLSPFVSLSVRF